MTAQEQYYLEFQRRRRYNLLQAQIAQRIANIRNAIKAGCDVRNDPKYKDEYLWLVSNFGEGLFVFEDNVDNVIVKEDQ